MAGMQVILVPGLEPKHGAVQPFEQYRGYLEISIK